MLTASLWVTGVYILLYYAILLFFSAHTTLLVHIFPVPIYFAAGGFALWHTGRLNGKAQLAWRLVALGILCFGVGEGLLAWYDLKGMPVGQVSLADGFYLAQEILQIIGVSLLIAQRASGPRMVKLYLDAACLAMIAASLSVQFLIGPVWNQSELNAFSRSVLIAYPMFDLALLWIVLTILYTWPKEARRMAGWLIASILMVIAADTHFLLTGVLQVYEFGSLFDPLWSTSQLLIVIAMLEAQKKELHQLDAPKTGVVEEVARAILPSPLLIYAPYVGLAGLAILALSVPQGFALKYGFLAAAVVVGIRQAATLLENRWLLQRAYDELKDTYEQQRVLNEELSLVNERLTALNEELDRRMREQLDWNHPSKN